MDGRSDEKMRKGLRVLTRYDSYLWYAFDLWRVVWIVGVDCKRESESTTLVHAFKRNQFDEYYRSKNEKGTFVRCDSKCEVKQIGGISEMSLHR